MRERKNNKKYMVSNEEINKKVNNIIDEEMKTIEHSCKTYIEKQFKILDYLLYIKGNIKLINISLIFMVISMILTVVKIILVIKG